MTNFCTLTRHRNATTIYVNRELVRALSFDGSAGGTVVIFDAAHTITVSEGIDAVALLLNGAAPR